MNRCQHVTTAGRRCRMLRAPGHPGLCAFHAQQDQEFINADEVVAELTSSSGDFMTPRELNSALGKLFKLVASQRIPPRQARALAYISQQIQNIVGPMRTAQFGTGLESAEDMQHLREAVAQLMDQPPSDADKSEVKKA
jgi:hypothetical protein